MAARSSVSQLPDRRPHRSSTRSVVPASGFSGYTDLADWLRGRRGSRSAAAPSGATRRSSSSAWSALRQTTALAKEAGSLLDDEGAHGATAVALAQSNLIELLFTYQE